MSVINQEIAMRIVFPFSIRQVEDDTVEVNLGEDGLPLPRAFLENAPALQEKWNLSDEQLNRVTDSLQDIALTELIRQTIAIR